MTTSGMTLDDVLSVVNSVLTHDDNQLLDTDLTVDRYMRKTGVGVSTAVSRLNTFAKNAGDLVQIVECRGPKGHKVKAYRLTEKGRKFAAVLNGTEIKNGKRNR